MAVVVVPFRPDGCPHRVKAWEFLKARYEARFPRWEVICGEGNPGAWCKAEAVMPALRNAPSDVVVIADSDCWSDGLESAVRAVTVGAAEWAMPHKTVYRLTELATHQFIGGESGLGVEVERRPYEGVWGGGIVVAHRDTFLSVPLDPRFKGPGQEDESWGLALWTLAGPGWRGKEPLTHLWHPPLPRLSPRRGSVASWELYRRYALANRKPDEMRALLAEFDRPASESPHSQSVVSVRG
jgi:hypothetical protein